MCVEFTASRSVASFLAIPESLVSVKVECKVWVFVGSWVKVNFWSTGPHAAAEVVVKNIGYKVVTSWWGNELRPGWIRRI